jgi:hypothetical protein
MPAEAVMKIGGWTDWKTFQKKYVNTSMGWASEQHGKVSYL